MNSIDFIKKSVNRILEMFPCSEVRYEHNEDFDIHLLKVMPENILKTVEYQNLSESIVDSFLDEYPLESITFLSTRSTLLIEKPTYVFYGKDYFVDIHVETARISTSSIESYLSKVISSQSIKVNVSSKITRQPKTSQKASSYAMAA